MQHKIYSDHILIYKPSENSFFSIFERISGVLLSFSFVFWLSQDYFASFYIVRYVFDKTNVLFYRMANYTVNECEVYANGLGKKIVYIQ